MIFTPNVKVEEHFYGLYPAVTNDLPLWLLLRGLSSFIPTWVLQKVVLFLILFLSGISAYRLCPAESKLGKYFAGFVYMLNPFVYVRFMAGHWVILLAYASIPFAIKQMINFFEKQSLGNSIKLVLLLTLVGIFNPHCLLFTLLVFAVFLAAKLIQSRRQAKIVANLIKMTVIISLAFLVVNLYWLVPTYITLQETSLGAISDKDLQAFTARAWGTGSSLLFSIASMHGFWREGYNYISTILPGWYLIFIFIMFLAVYGVVVQWSNKKIGLYVRCLTIVAFLSLILGTGVSTPYFSGFFQFLFDKFFLFRGMRDSHKFVALLALAYSYLGGLGVANFSKSLWTKAKGKGVERRRIAGGILITLALVSPFVYSLNMLGGFNHELKVRAFPNSWYEVNSYLNQQRGDFNTLFFPWHGYMTFSWSERRIMNPVYDFFDKPVIRSVDMDIAGMETQPTKLVHSYIRFLLDHRGEIENFGALVAPLNIKYVILAKEVDFKNYDFLYEQKDLSLVFENTQLIIFKNENELAELYYTTKISPISNWGDLLQLVKDGGSLVDSVYLIDGKRDLANGEISGSITYKRISPVKYEIEVPEDGIVIYSAPYNEQWLLEEQKPFNNLGLTNAFQVSKGKSTLYYSRFTLLLATYSISGVGVLGLVTLLVVNRRRFRE